MANLLAISIPVKRDPAWADWAKSTRASIKAAGVPVSKWQLLFYHMTILFVDEDDCVADLTPGFAQIVKSCPAIPFTVDKLDAFTTTNGAEHIICLSSTQVPQQIHTLASESRTMADGLNAKYDHRAFIPHITFGHVPADKISLQDLRTILQALPQPSFHCLLNEAEHRFRRSNGTIKKWRLR